MFPSPKLAKGMLACPLLIANLLYPGVACGAVRVVLAAVSKYDNLPQAQQLPCCNRDVEELLRVLVERTGVAKRDDVLLIYEQAERRDHRPTRSNIVNRLDEFLKDCRPEDALIFYCTGHGMFDARSGRCLLLASDFDSSDPDNTCVDMAWLRNRLLEARVKSRIALLDVCHAGGIAKGPAPFGGLTAKEFEVVFRETDSIYAISSCDHRESSVVWRDKGMSVFTYWLNLGLQGCADSNANGFVSMDELFHFVQAHVPGTAAMLGEREGREITQTPRRICHGERLGDPQMFPVPAEPAADTFRRIAQLTADLVEHHLPQGANGRPPRLYVHEFTNRVGAGQEYGGALGTLGRAAAMRTESILAGRSARRYAVVPRELVEPDCAHLDRDGFSVLKDRVDIVIGGAFNRRGHLPGQQGPDRLQFQLRLYRARTGAFLENIALSLLVNDELWAMLGASGEFPRAPNNGPPDRPSDVVTATLPAPAVALVPERQPLTPQVRNQVERRRHPLVDPRPGAPYEVVIRKGPAGQPREVVDFAVDPEDENRALFGLSANDEFDVEFVNNTRQYVSVVVLVDGLNVLNQQPQPPAEARSWLFPGETRLRIQGWATGESTVGDSISLRVSNFVATRPGRSVAGRLKRTADLGIVQVVVFATNRVPRHARSALGIGEGAVQVQQFNAINDYRKDPTQMLAAYTLRYVDENHPTLRRAQERRLSQR